jgi:hypothetical protein
LKVAGRGLEGLLFIGDTLGEAVGSIINNRKIH